MNCGLRLSNSKTWISTRYLSLNSVAVELLSVEHSAVTSHESSIEQSSRGTERSTVRTRNGAILLSPQSRNLLGRCVLTTGALCLDRHKNHDFSVVKYLHHYGRLDHSSILIPLANWAANEESTLITMIMADGIVSESVQLSYDKVISVFFHCTYMNKCGAFLLKLWSSDTRLTSEKKRCTFFYQDYTSNYLISEGRSSTPRTFQYLLTIVQWNSRGL